MIKTYTDRWNGFQFREPVYLDGTRVKNKFDLVKWVDYLSPVEAVDFYTGEKVIKNEGCFTIATLTWNPKEEDFDFASCGLRYLEHRIDGLEKFILDFCDMMKEELTDQHKEGEKNR